MGEWDDMLSRGEYAQPTRAELESELATLRVRDEHYEVLLADNLRLRAELDNLRDRVTAPLSDDEIDDLGKELDNPNKVYQLDRIAACIESIITTRAALVRGSDDE